jgi:hypothetical protein
MRVGLEYQELESILRRWGEWQERHYLDASLPHQSSHTLIYSDQPPGHKILCAEMERGMWKINYHIERLPQSHRRTLYVWYAVNLKVTGGYWDAKEKAERLRLRLNTLRFRVTRARKALYKMLTPCDLSSKRPTSCVSVT